MNLSRFLFSITRGAKHPRYSEYDYRKIVVINTFLLLAMVTLFVMGLHILIHENLFYSACVNFLTVISIIIFMIYFRLSADFLFYKIVLTVISGSFMIYLVATGGIENTGPLWTYILPILSYFLLGHKKATTAIIIILLLYIIILFVPGIPFVITAYPLYYKVRFILTTIFVSIVAYSQEYGRFKAFEKQIILINKLKSANDEIKELKDLIPICANCKKVRNDKGYWEQVDSYLQKRAKISFTHSICKECSDKLYGGENWYKKK